MGKSHPSFFSKTLLALRLYRPYQWTKNLLLLVPAFLAHSWKFDLNILLAFISFSAMASAVYVFNDIIDLKSDLLHWTKKNRPIAAGIFSKVQGLGLAVFSLIIAIGLAAFLDKKFFLVIVSYFILNIFYSFWLKKSPFVDILLLAFFYTLRLMAGAAVSQVILSPWLLSFSTFLFFSLACIKRYSELIHPNYVEKKSGRPYLKNDSAAIFVIGSCAGLIASLVLVLYIDSSDVVKLYRIPQGLWVLAPLMLYWISRLWFLAHRQQIIEDPVLFALKDKASWFVGFLMLLIILYCI